MTTRKSSTDLSISERQMSLVGMKESPDPFKKSVHILHSKPKSPLSLLQRKIGNSWLKNAIENKPDKDGWWELSIKDMARDIGFDSNNRQYLKQSAEAMMSIVFDWDVLAPAEKKIIWKASVLFPEIEVYSDVVRYQFSSKMRDLMVNPEIYALIDMSIVRKFRRTASLGIWEFCVRFEKIKRTSEVKWEKFRDMILGESTDNKTYQEYKFFKSKVLKPGIAEINSETNNTIVLVESKVGKRVSAISFVVSCNAPVAVIAQTDVPIEICKELVQLGIPSSEAKKICKNQTLIEIRGALDYTKRRMSDQKARRLENPAAYFRHTLTNHYASDKNVPIKTGTCLTVRSTESSFDIKASYAIYQLKEAEKYFAELDIEEQNLMILSYNEQQKAGPLQLKKKATKLALAGFYQWLAKTTWGEPTTDEMRTFTEGAENPVPAGRGQEEQGQQRCPVGG